MVVPWGGGGGDPWLPFIPLGMRGTAYFGGGGLLWGGVGVVGCAGRSALGRFFPFLPVFLRWRDVYFTSLSAFRCLTPGFIGAGLCPFHRFSGVLTFPVCFPFLLQSDNPFVLLSSFRHCML